MSGSWLTQERVEKSARSGSYEEFRLANEVLARRKRERELEEEVRGLRQSFMVLHNELDCRIEHGAESGGHLEFARNKIKAILGSVSCG